MTDDEIYAAIQADDEAKALALAGDDAGCAARLVTIVPPESDSGRLTDSRHILAAFANPADAEAALEAFEGLAAGNAVFRRVVRYLDPPGMGIDFSSPAVQAAIDNLPIPDASKATLKSLGRRPASVGPDDVSRAMLRDRPDGRIA